MNLTLSLTPPELDYIANALSRCPWGEVNALMGNIQQQVMKQQEAQNATPSTPATHVPGYGPNGARDPSAAPADDPAAGGGG